MTHRHPKAEELSLKLKNHHFLQIFCLTPQHLYQVFQISHRIHSDFHHPTTKNSLNPHNDKNKTCYFSHLLLNNPPMPAIFSGEYNSDDVICNKLTPILSDYDLSNDILRDNLTYNCVTRNNEELGIKYINGDSIVDFTNKDRNYITPPRYEMQYLDSDSSTVNKNKTYMIPAYDTTLSEVNKGIINWNDLTRKPLEYKYEYKIKINKS